MTKKVWLNSNLLWSFPNYGQDIFCLSALSVGTEHVWCLHMSSWDHSLSRYHPLYDPLYDHNHQDNSGHQVCRGYLWMCLGFCGLGAAVLYFTRFTIMIIISSLPQSAVNPASIVLRIESLTLFSRVLRSRSQGLCTSRRWCGPSPAHSSRSGRHQSPQR